MAKLGGISLPFSLEDYVWFCRGDGASQVEQGECPACKGQASVLLGDVQYCCPHPKCQEGTLVYYEYSLLPEEGQVLSIHLSYDLVELDSGPEKQSSCSVSVRTDAGGRFTLNLEDISHCEEDAEKACAQRMKAALEEQKQKKVC